MPKHINCCQLFTYSNVILLSSSFARKIGCWFSSRRLFSCPIVCCWKCWEWQMSPQAILASLILEFECVNVSDFHAKELRKSGISLSALRWSALFCHRLPKDTHKTLSCLCLYAVHSYTMHRSFVAFVNFNYAALRFPELNRTKTRQQENNPKWE